MDKNKELCGLLGICWHEIIVQASDDINFTLNKTYCSCGKAFRYDSDYFKHTKESNPEFTTPEGIVQLLGIMRERKDWDKFAQKYLHLKMLHFFPDGTNRADYEISINYILNTTGKLRDAAIEFLKDRKAVADKCNAVVNLLRKEMSPLSGE